MNLKNLTLASALVLAIPSLALVSCKKEAGKITVKITADDANTARTWIGDSLASTQKQKNINIGSDIKWLDSLATKEKTNTNDAIIKSVKVVYTDKDGKPQNKDFTNSEAQKFATGFDFTDVGVGKEISVTATAVEGTGKAKVLTEKDLNDAAKIVENKVKKSTENSMGTSMSLDYVTKGEVAKEAGLSKEANGGGAAEVRIVTLKVDISGVSGSDASKEAKQAQEVSVEAKGTAQK